MTGKFELWFGCFGNGTTVCNKVVTRNGEYKKSPIFQRVETSGFMFPNLTSRHPKWKKIRAMASRNKAEFQRYFE